MVRETARREPLDARRAVMIRLRSRDRKPRATQPFRAYRVGEDPGTRAPTAGPAAQSPTAKKEEIMIPEIHLLPEVHKWWPHLSARSKQRLEKQDDGVVPDDVREEIERIVGEAVDPSAQLSDGDRTFIRTQREMVD
jgi:hypothetical protein